jgi:CRISPR-associated protein Cas2
MWVIVTYDVATDSAKGRARLRRVAQVCKDYGQRVQKSVFECTVTDKTYERMRSRLLKVIVEEEDSLRFYKLPEERDRRVEEFGRNLYMDFRGPLVV